MVSALRARVAAGETLNDDDIPVVLRHIRRHPLYENVFTGDSFGHESSKVDYNNFENNYRYFEIKTLKNFHAHHEDRK